MAAFRLCVAAAVLLVLPDSRAGAVREVDLRPRVVAGVVAAAAGAVVVD